MPKLTSIQQYYEGEHISIMFKSRKLETGSGHDVYIYLKVKDTGRFLWLEKHILDLWIFESLMNTSTFAMMDIW